MQRKASLPNSKPSSSGRTAISARAQLIDRFYLSRDVAIVNLPAYTRTALVLGCDWRASDHEKRTSKSATGRKASIAHAAAIDFTPWTHAPFSHMAPGAPQSCSSRQDRDGGAWLMGDPVWRLSISAQALRRRRLPRAGVSSCDEAHDGSGQRRNRQAIGRSQRFVVLPRRWVRKDFRVAQPMSPIGERLGMS